MGKRTHSQAAENTLCSLFSKGGAELSSLACKKDMDDESPDTVGFRLRSVPLVTDVISSDLKAYTQPADTDTKIFYRTGSRCQASDSHRHLPSELLILHVINEVVLVMA